MTAEPKRVLCVGECMVEFIRRHDGAWSQGFAGDSFNVAWAFWALLPPSAEVSYLTRVGTDALSDAMLRMFEEAGNTTDHIARDQQRTAGLYTIQTDPSGERSFSYWRSESAARSLARDEAALRNALRWADLVYLSGITLAILPPEDRARLMSCIGQCGGREFKVAFDPNIRLRLWESPAVAAREVAAAAKLSDIVLPTHDDEATTYGDVNAVATLARYAELGVPEIVVKDGTRPSLYLADGRTGVVSVQPVAQPVDTTGAGDSFNGAYLAARLAGLPQKMSIRPAQQVSACVVGHRCALVAATLLRAAQSGGAEHA